MTKPQYALAGVAAALCAAAGLLLGWFIWGGKADPEGPAVAVRQRDESLVLERQPAQVVTPPVHAIPAKSREERRVSVTIQPTAAACPTVTVDLSLVRDADGGARVIASSPDGRVVKGLDVPIGAPGASWRDGPRPKWAAGMTYAGGNAFGVLVHRDIWRFRVGVEVAATRDRGAEARLVAAWTW